MTSLPYKMIFPTRQGVIFIYILVLLIAGEGSVAAQNVQTGHYAPGWNGSLKAGMMAQDPGFYMQSTTMYFNARNFKDGSGDTATRHSGQSANMRITIEGVERLEKFAL